MFEIVQRLQDMNISIYAKKYININTYTDFQTCWLVNKIHVCTTTHVQLRKLLRKTREHRIMGRNRSYGFFIFLQLRSTLSVRETKLYRSTLFLREIKLYRSTLSVREPKLYRSTLSIYTKLYRSTHSIYTKLYRSTLSVRETKLYRSTLSVREPKLYRSTRETKLYRSTLSLRETKLY